MKKFLVACILVFLSGCSYAGSDSRNLLLGVIVGATIAQPQYYPQPIYQIHPPIYYSPPVVYQQPIIVSPSQIQFYDPRLHGYCAGYQDYQYAQCIDNARRNEFENRYRFR